MTDENQFQRVQWDGDQPHLSDERGASFIGWGGNPGLSDADLELLTLAARALGAQVETIEGEQWLSLHFADGTVLHAWNSLLHPDDTFNLAVDLGMDVFQAATDREARAVAPLQRVIAEPWGDDKRAATRLAVTRAAAEIGKAK